MTPTSEILNKAADLIETHGWGRGFDTWEANGSGLCLEGGIMAAMAHTGGHNSVFHACPAYVAVSNYLGRDLAEDEWTFRGVWVWNDEQGRTASEVIEVLRAAAIIEAARETELAKVEVSA